jgi:hypothetical protein
MQLVKKRHLLYRKVAKDLVNKKFAPEVNSCMQFISGLHPKIKNIYTNSRLVNKGPVSTSPAFF